MMKSLLLIILLVGLSQQQSVTPYYILPVQTTQNVVTSYSFLFGTDTSISTNAQVAIVFPFEFSPNELTKINRVQCAIGNNPLSNVTYSIRLYTVTINLDQIPIGNVTVVINNILNPKDYSTSSFFSVQTLFKNVVVTSNS